MVAPIDKDPAMLFFGRDFYEDEAVRLMSLEQEAIYLRLLWHAWREGSIPADVAALAALLRIQARRFAKLWPGVAVKWHANEDGSRLVNRRQEREREQRAETKQRFREGARIVNAKRWGSRSPSESPSDNEATGVATPSESPSGRIRSTSTSTEVPRVPRAPRPDRPEDVSEQTWEHWLGHRRAKRATVNATVIATLRKQAQAAGMTLEEAMAHCVAQGHQGFFPPDKKNPRHESGQWNAPAPVKPAPSIQHEPGNDACRCDACDRLRLRKRQAQ